MGNGYAPKGSSPENSATRRAQARRGIAIFRHWRIDQALLSGASFVIGFLMIRYTSGQDYRQFVLVWGAADAFVAAATTLPAWAALQREYLRAVLLVYSRPHSILHADIAMRR